MPPAVTPPALPAPIAAPVSKETRLAYVLQHFRLAYADVPDVSIGYADTQPAIEVVDGAGNFFQQAEPYPSPPNYREWDGLQLPFFFDNYTESPLLNLGSGRVTINADIIAAAFYLLSGWQEYFSDTRDRHGRFPYAASVQKRYGFVTLPVVNYYFEVLKTAIEHVTGQVLRPRHWAGDAPFAAFISHDIDNMRSAWKAPAKAALAQRQWLKLGQQLWQHLTQPDAWDNLETVATTTAKHGATSTFFILPEHAPGADGIPNADYTLSVPLLLRIKYLAKQGEEISVHGSIGTAEHGEQLRREQQKLPVPPLGLRYHYLRWEPRCTPSLVDEAGFDYDSTLGFAEHFGFRHSFCHPFYPFNFREGTGHSFLEIPLNVMDASLHHPNYLQLPPAEIVPALQPMLTEIERFGGVATVLWHNENFDPANTTNGPQEFDGIMAELQRRRAGFVTGKELASLAKS
jgi:hypothetical protein